MAVNTIEYWKNKKNKKQKIFATSYLNNTFSTFVDQEQIEIERLDIKEVAKIFELDDSKRLSFDDLRFFLRTRKKQKTFFAVDIPLCETCANNALAEIMRLIQQYSIDFVCLDITVNNINLAKKLYLLNIPVIMTVDYNDGIYSDERLIENIVEVGNTCASIIICENVPTQIYEKVKATCKIPILVDAQTKNADGFYFKYSDIVGIFDNPNKLTNLNQLISGAFKDATEIVKI